MSELESVVENRPDNAAAYIEKLEAKLAAAEAALAAMTTQLATVCSERDCSDDDREMLKAALAAMTAERDGLRRRLDEAYGRGDALREALELAYKQATDIRAELPQLRHDIENLMQERNDLAGQLESTDHLFGLFKQERNAARARADKLADALQGVLDEIEGYSGVRIHSAAAARATLAETVTNGNHIHGIPIVISADEMGPDHSHGTPTIICEPES